MIDSVYHFVFSLHVTRLCMETLPIQGVAQYSGSQKCIQLESYVLCLWSGTMLMPIRYKSIVARQVSAYFKLIVLIIHHHKMHNIHTHLEI